MLDPHALLRAEQQLEDATGRAVVLTVREELRAGRVARVNVAGLPVETAIVKVADPLDPAFDRASLHAEQAALELLRAVAPHVAPVLLAAEPDRGIVVMEDLGPGPSLADLLRGEDPARARAGAIAWAQALGDMHAATAGFALSHAQRRRALSSVDPDADQLTLRGIHVDDLLARVDEGCRAAGIAPPDDAASDVAAVRAALADPGDLLVLTSGDPCPDNGAVRDDGAVLFDFEVAAFRHALLDAAHLWLPFPSCWCWRTLPPGLADELRAAHRERLASRCPSAADPAAHARAAACATAAWGLWALARRLGTAATDHGVRPRVLAALDALVGPDVAPALPRLAGWADRARGALSARWALEVPVVLPYPAFGGPPLPRPA